VLNHDSRGKVQEHLSDQQIQSYREKKIAADQLLELDDHVQTCEECRNRLSEESDHTSFESFRSELRVIAAAGPGHVSYGQLERLVDGQAGNVETENVQSHLEICDFCRAEEHDLRSFKEELNRKAASQKVIPFRRSLLFSLPLKIAGAAALIAFFTWIATIPMRNRIQNLESQLLNEQKKTEKLLAENKILQDQYAGIISSQKTISPAPVLVALNDGNSKIQIDQQGNLEGLPEIPAFYHQKIVDLLRKQQVETPLFLREMIGKQEVLLGKTVVANHFPLLSPVGTVILEDQPSFRWTPLNGADGYRLYIYDGNYNEIAASPLLKETGWKATQSLHRGKEYNWQVAAMKGGKEFLSPVPPAPEAKFQVLSKDRLKEVEHIQQSSRNSHLVMGTLYAQYGLLDEAEHEFSELLQQNPQSEEAKKILQSLQSIRPNRLRPSSKQ
jgi:hypothetical protein